MDLARPLEPGPRHGRRLRDLPPDDVRGPGRLGRALGSPVDRGLRAGVPELPRPGGSPPRIARQVGGGAGRADRGRAGAGGRSPLAAPPAPAVRRAGSGTLLCHLPRRARRAEPAADHRRRPGLRRLPFRLLPPESSPAGAAHQSDDDRRPLRPPCPLRQALRRCQSRRGPDAVPRLSPPRGRRHHGGPAFSDHLRSVPSGPARRVGSQPGGSGSPPAAAAGAGRRFPRRAGLRCRLLAVSRRLGDLAPVAAPALRRAAGPPGSRGVEGPGSPRPERRRHRGDGRGDPRRESGQGDPRRSGAGRPGRPGGTARPGGGSRAASGAPARPARRADEGVRARRRRRLVSGSRGRSDPLPRRRGAPAPEAQTRGATGPCSDRRRGGSQAPGQGRRSALRGRRPPLRRLAASSRPGATTCWPAAALRRLEATTCSPRTSRAPTPGSRSPRPRPRPPSTPAPRTGPRPEASSSRTSRSGTVRGSTRIRS